jgi:hypothetical protein
MGARLEAELRGNPKSSKVSKGKGKRSKEKSLDKVQDKNSRVSKKAKEKKAKNKDPNLMDYGSLWTSNVIQDARRNEGRPALPAMTSTRRDQALKALVASVPLENRKMARMDMNYLDSACKDFTGRLSVRAMPGNDGWRVTGLNCILKHHQLLGILRESRMLIPN